MINATGSKGSLCVSRVRCRGFSLIELMIALVIGLVLTVGAVQLFLSGKQAFNQVTSLGQRQEALRFLVDSLSYDIRSATSFGIAGDQDQLQVFHVNKPNNSICNGDLNYSVTYYQDQGSIYVDPSCSASDAIVIGVGEIHFTYLSGSYGIIVRVTLVDSEGRLDDEVVRFRVANRSRVSEVIEFGGGT